MEKIRKKWMNTNKQIMENETNVISNDGAN